MEVNWAFTARTFLDQLPKREQQQVMSSVEHAAQNWGVALGSSRLKALQGFPKDESEQLYLLRAGHDLRVLISRRENIIVVVDVVRRSQIERLQSIQRRFKGSSE
jgi:hypothetical protein